MNMCYGYELEIPTTKEKVGFKSFETGKLTYGNANPTSDDYQSLADFIYKDGKLEIKNSVAVIKCHGPLHQRK